jgi:hypothetical protein
VRVSDRNPRHAEQRQHQEWVVDPDSAACVGHHANIRSHERLFYRNNFRGRSRNKRITALLLACLTALATACLPDPRLAQTRELLDQLASARSMLAEQPPRVQEGCGLVGVIATRLYGEPGLADVRQAWPELRDATNALGAVCGQETLLAQPQTGSSALLAARERWQQGIQREMGVACDYLRAAAAALDRAAAC